MITAQSYELSNQNRMFGNQSSAISRCTEIELRTQPGAAEMAVMLAASACPSPAPGLRIKPELLLELGQWRVKVPGRGGSSGPPSRYALGLSSLLGCAHGGDPFSLSHRHW